ncbi:MAG: hypothetical protein WBQ78_00505 [Gammaproteobacteria bacterium]
MEKQLLRLRVFAAGMLLIVVSATQADEICSDQIEFEKNGWQLRPVQQAMDIYLRDHRMRVNWLKEPRPPSAVGRDYYEWLWIDEFGARMKAELVQRYCAGAADSGARE